MKKIFLLSFLVSVYSCSQLRQIGYDISTNDDAIKFAISDFIQNKEFKKSEKVFSLNSRVFDNVIGISILANQEKLLISPSNKIGYVSLYFPSRFIERDGRLFYWSDSTSVLTEDMVKILSKYKVIDSSNINDVNVLPMMNLKSHDSEAMHYYICAKSGNYTKKRSSTALDYEDNPNLSCR
ncbi:hypothetical protein HUK80_17730 [Flavobacterium sp. MAH-1]|uniref:Lipoprotein n=1 Tax=Flavobacterium agri TaxID=2743471 RepID=A0A7Y8Y5E8_9FLAO|nr:hypothetical protein [Flavobacterium agri]NUY82748.1 hypothetical protein [Flavobacterium agri]NYA72771.1 hypothetical protein [Flavobacterium agri]